MLLPCFKHSGVRKDMGAAPSSTAGILERCPMVRMLERLLLINTGGEVSYGFFASRQCACVWIRA